MCLKDKLFVSISRYKSCCDEKATGGSSRRRSDTRRYYHETVAEQESDTLKTEYITPTSQQGKDKESFMLF